MTGLNEIVWYTSWYWKLLTRGVLYTAITRARELLLLVGNEELIAQMTQNNRRNKRYSGLRFRLQGEA